MADGNRNFTIRLLESKRKELEQLSIKTGHGVSDIVRGLIYARLAEEKAKQTQTD